MGKIKKPKNIKILEYLEKKHNVVDKFKYKTSTVWINIKNYIYAKSVNFEFFAENKKWDKKKILFFTFLSLKNIFKKRNGILFVSAGSGIIDFNGKIIDVYKNPVEEKDIIYFASIDIPKRMYLFKEYYKQNKIIVHSLVFSVLRNLIAKFLKNYIKIDIEEIINYLQSNNVHVQYNDIRYIYAKFIAGYWIYKVYFKFVKINKAYIVSAYTNTELIAVLKEKNIPIIEIQHGIIGETHRGYNYKIKSSLLPTPDKILVYNEFWKKELLEAGYFTKNQIDVFERFQYSQIKNIKIFDKPFIVFTGQGIKQKEIQTFLENSKEYLIKNNIYLVYLPHPSEEFDFDIECKYIKILKNKKYLTEQYIKSAIAHISIYSSCHFDAIHFHNKTYIFDILEENIMEYYKNKYPEKFLFIKKIEEIEI